VPTAGRLAEDRMTAAIATLQRFATMAREQGATRLIGVATEAVRRASNGHAFLDQVRTETGWQVRLISGDEEAMLTFRGLASDIDLTGLLFVADIGGASTEVITAHDGQIMQAKSLQLGSGSLTEAYIVADPPTGAEVNACQSAATTTLLDNDRSPTQGATLVVVGGTGTYLARLLDDEPVINQSGVEHVRDRCLMLTAAELARLLDIQEARARVLPAGIAIVLATIDLVQPTRIETAQSGIRRGLILDALRELP